MINEGLYEQIDCIESKSGISNDMLLNSISLAITKTLKSVRF